MRYCGNNIRSGCGGQTAGKHNAFVETVFEYIELVEWVTRVRCIRWGPGASRGMDNFWQLSSPLKSTGGHCCSVHSKKINDGISATAADECIAPAWPVSHVKNLTCCDAASQQNSVIIVVVILTNHFKL